MQKHEDEKIPEESEHCKDKFCCCSPSSRTVCLSFICHRRFRSLRSLHQRLWIFALFEDGLSKLYLPPQVPVALLPSPAVMDIRPLRGRFVVISVQNTNVLKRCVFFSF